MERRSFIKALLGTAAAAAATLQITDPEFVLWRPGAKTIFLPEGPIAIKNLIRPATEAETAQITGNHYVRVAWKAGGRYRGVDMISLDDFKRGYHKHLGPTGISKIDVHFDDGTIAFDQRIDASPADIRADAVARKVKNEERIRKEHILRNRAGEWERYPHLFVKGEL